MQPPHGPFKIGVNRQVTIPAELMKQISLAPGDSVYLAVSEAVEGALVVVPVERLVSWIDGGITASRSASPVTDHERP